MFSITSLLYLREEGIECVKQQIGEMRLFSLSVSDAMGYHLILGESFPSFSDEMLETWLFFWFGGLGEDHVASLIWGTVLAISGVSKEDKVVYEFF